MAAARFARKRQLGYALKRRITALDPAEDHEEVTRLTLEVLYGEQAAIRAINSEPSAWPSRQSSSASSTRLRMPIVGAFYQRSSR
jgi:hypothetical protein